MQNTKRVRANPGQGGLLREEILRAAEELVVEAGSEDALTMRAVARRAGVTTPSVYLHFADKEALLEAVCLRVWDQLGAQVGDAVDGAEDPFVALARRGRAYARFALDHPVQYRVLMMRTITAEKPNGPPPAAAACFGHFERAVADCVEAGVLHGAPRALAVSLWSALHGCVSLLIAQPSFPWPEGVDALIDRTLLMSGLGTALASRIPRGTPLPSDKLARELDALAARLT